MDQKSAMRVRNVNMKKKLNPAHICEDIQSHFFPSNRHGCGDIQHANYQDNDNELSMLKCIVILFKCNC